MDRKISLVEVTVEQIRELAKWVVFQRGKGLAHRRRATIFIQSVPRGLLMCTPLYGSRIGGGGLFGDHDKVCSQMHVTTLHVPLYLATYIHCSVV